MRLIKAIRLTVLAFGAFIMIYAGAAVLGAVAALPNTGTPPEDTANIEILLVAGPIHYDLLLPLDDATHAHFGELETTGLPLSNPAAQWLVIGWGARDFYTATGSYDDLAVKTVLKGLFGDQSVLRMDLAGQLPRQLATRSLSLSHAQYLALMASISSSFKRDTAGHVIALDHPGFSPTDVFYEAVEPFDMFRTCNVWVARQLRAAGLRFGIWTPTPYAITLSHWLFHTP